jgi:tRNA U34 5-methylaminomethyl-2-thiouridine-forming methyltransferase MnmC
MCLAEGKCDRFSMELYLQDALEVLKMLSGKFDAIFFDPFSSAKNPEMWSVAVFERMKELLAEDGSLLTYAGGKKIRNMMRQAGFTADDTPLARAAFMPGTVVRHNYLH